MRPYVATFAARLRAQLQYRAAAWAGIGTQVFFGMVRVMVFDAFYRSSTAVQPLSHDQAMSYIWLGQALLMIVPFRLDRELMELIRSGNVAYELTRPVRLTWLWLARALADRIGPAMLRCLPQVVFSGLLLRWVGWGHLALDGPAGPTAAVLFAVSIAAGTLVSSSLSVLGSSTMFWTISGRGAASLFSVVMWMLSGITVPLPLFPDWFQPVLSVLPFRGMMDVPFRIYVGDIVGGRAVLEIVGQLAWAAAVAALASIAIRRGLRRLVIQGG